MQNNYFCIVLCEQIYLSLFLKVGEGVGAQTLSSTSVATAQWGTVFGWEILEIRNAAILFWNVFETIKPNGQFSEPEL